MHSRQTIAIYRRSSLGDVLLTVPLVRALSAAGHNAVLVTHARFVPLFAAGPVRAMDITEFRADVASAGHGPEIILDLQNNLRSRRDLRRLGPGSIRRWHMRSAGRLALAGLGLDTPITAPPAAVAYCEAAGVPPPTDPADFRLHVDAAWAAGASAMLAAEPKPRVLIQSASRHALKDWPPGAWTGTIATLRARGLGVVNLSPSVAGEISLAGQPLTVVAGALAGAAAFVGPDSGLLHLARAVGTPHVGIFGPTSVARWAHGFAGTQVLTMALPCAPCSRHGEGECWRGTHACLRELPVEAVANAVVGLMPMRETRELAPA